MSTTVLVVEDDVVVQRLVAAFLRSAGHQVLLADNAEIALALFAAREASIGLLVTDLALPDRRGPELARECQRRKPGLEVLFVTGWQHLEPEDAAPGWRVLAKPFSRGQLLDAVGRALADAPIGCAES
jgi:DNA-binding NtrC family response regulator